MGFEAPRKWLDVCEVQSGLCFGTEMSHSLVLVKPGGKSFFAGSARLCFSPVKVVAVYCLETFLRSPVVRWQWELNCKEHLIQELS